MGLNAVGFSPKASNEQKVIMKKHLGVTPLFLFQIASRAQTNVDTFIRGVDMSFTPHTEDLGGKSKLNKASGFCTGHPTAVVERRWQSGSDGLRARFIDSAHEMS